MASELLSFRMDVRGVERSFAAIGDGLADTKPPLRIFGSYLGKRYHAKIRSGGFGAWKALAESTQKHIMGGATTAEGKFRAPILRKMAQTEGFLRKRIREAKARGEKTVSFEKRLAGLQRAAKENRAHRDRIVNPEKVIDLAVVGEGIRARVHVTTSGYDRAKNVSFPRHLREPGRTFQVPASAISLHRAGHYVVSPSALGVVRGDAKTPLDRHQFYGKLGFFKVRVSTDQLTIGLPDVKGEWLWRLNDGDGPIPARPVIPDTLEQEDVDKLIEIAEKHAIYIWETTP